MPCLKQLWQDERGVISSGELILLSTIVLLGMIVGLTTLRDQVVQELGDAASAVGTLNQSYSFAGTMIGAFSVAGSDYEDLTDFCEVPDTPASEPACISVQAPPAEESS